MYYIYEIPGVKIGCTKEINERQRHQKDKGEMIILEEHEDIYVASAREIELQKEHGYHVDAKPYWQIINMPTKESRSSGGRISGPINGRKNVENGNLGRARAIMHSSPNAPYRQKRECPYCGIIKNPGAIASHIKFKHKINN